jgi:hypothetical protein
LFPAGGVSLKTGQARERNILQVFHYVIERVYEESDDKTAIGSDQHALYFQTVAGKKYEIQGVTAFGGVWQDETNVTATTTQKRVLINKPVDQGFYRVVLMP